MIEATYPLCHPVIAPAVPAHARPAAGLPDRVPEMKWLAECSVAALREALGTVAPELSGYPVTVPGSPGQQDPLWHRDARGR